MPVECNIEIEPVDQEDFHALDKVVMGHAFDVHNTLGRFCDERIYQDELAHRCRTVSKMCLLNATTAWHLSALRQHQGSYKTHLARLLAHTCLKTFHWINLDQRTITLKTIRKK